MFNTSSSFEASAENCKCQSRGDTVWKAISEFQKNHLLECFGTAHQVQDKTENFVDIINQVIQVNGEKTEEKCTKHKYLQHSKNLKKCHYIVTNSNTTEITDFLTIPC